MSHIVSSERTSRLPACLHINLFKPSIKLVFVCRAYHYTVSKDYHDKEVARYIRQR